MRIVNAFIMRIDTNIPSLISWIWNTMEKHKFKMMCFVVIIAQ